LPLATYFLINFHKYCVSPQRPWFSFRDVRDVLTHPGYDMTRMQSNDFSFGNDRKSSCYGGCAKGEAEMRAALLQGEG